MLSKSRFNPAPGFADFWHEIRRPRPYRWAFALASMLPVMAILYWAVSQVEYKAPERPQIDYISPPSIPSGPRPRSSPPTAPIRN
jgi:hypothetical protein